MTSTPVINTPVIVGQFVSKKNSSLIALGLGITVLLITQIILRTSCKSIFKKSKFKRYCKNLISNKLIHLFTIYMIYILSSPILYKMHDLMVNRKAYLTLDWFGRYLERMSKYNLNGLNFNIHAKFE